MKKDDLWQLDGNAGPALPLSEDALHRLVSGALGQAYGANEASKVEGAKSGVARGKSAFVAAGIAACIVTMWALSGTETAQAPAAPPSVAPIAAPVMTNTGSLPSLAPAVTEPMPSVDVQALPSAPHAPERAPRAASRSSEASRDLLREANRLRGDRRWDEAAALYRRVADARGEESTTAMLALASLRLEHQNDAREARRLYRAVVDAAPNGPLAEEARWGIVMACQALADVREERAALDVFLTHHPSSLSAPKAKKRLAEIEVTP
jgi:Tetratricopeptide repeat